MSRAWQRVGQLGTEGLAPEEVRKVRSLNQFELVAVVSLSIYAVGYALAGPDFTRPLLVTIACVLAHMANLWNTSKGRHGLAVFLFLFLLNAQIAYATAFVGTASGFHFFFLPFTALVPQIVPKRRWYLLGFTILSTVCFIYFSYFWRSSQAQVQVDVFFETITRFLTMIVICVVLGLTAWLVDSDVRHAEKLLLAEHDRSERLLLNILPASISTRLKSGTESIADGFADVTVVFADIVGFTELSAKLPPQELVAVLNEVFTRFDDLAERHGLEKIKTIGDAYMVAAGLPIPREDHAVAAASMAIDMIDALHEVNQSHGHHLEIRIGLNSGPVVAGVIGKKKFIYDLWGDTVNTASRMESHGEKSEIHVSESTAALLEDTFDLEARGSIKVKGKGQMTTFFVRERRDPNAPRRSPKPAPPMFMQKAKALLDS